MEGQSGWFYGSRVMQIYSSATSSRKQKGREQSACSGFLRYPSSTHSRPLLSSLLLQLPAPLHPHWTWAPGAKRQPQLFGPAGWQIPWEPWKSKQEAEAGGVASFKGLPSFFQFSAHVLQRQLIGQSLCIFIKARTGKSGPGGCLGARQTVLISSHPVCTVCPPCPQEGCGPAAARSWLCGHS